MRRTHRAALLTYLATACVGDDGSRDEDKGSESEASDSMEPTGSESTGTATDSDGGTDSDSGSTTDTGDDGGPAPVDRPVIYELVVRHFSNDNPNRAPDGTLSQNGVGKFDEINDAALQSLKTLGVTHVWLAGVFRQATLINYGAYGLPPEDPDVVKGRAGAWDAVRDYYDVSPDYALDPTRRRAEFDDLVQRIHAHGLFVMLDLFPDRVARGYGSVVAPATDFGIGDDESVFFSPTNGYYYLPGETLALSRPPGWEPEEVVFDGRYDPEDGSSGRTVKVTGGGVISAMPEPGDRYDTVKLNWGRDFTVLGPPSEPIPPTWWTMNAILSHWQAAGIDGFRCDAVDAVPAAAWTWLIQRARERDPDVLFVAASSNDIASVLGAGFDAVEHGQSLAVLKSMFQGTASQAEYQQMMDVAAFVGAPYFVEYLEHHGEARIPAPIATEDGSAAGFGAMEAGYQLAPLVFLSGSGAVLVYNGQEVGEAGLGLEGYSPDDGRTSLYDYWSPVELAKWVNALAYDGGDLSPDQVALRNFYADVLALVSDDSVVGRGYRSLDGHNHTDHFADAADDLYSVVRFEPNSGRAVVIVTNFALNRASSGPIRLPQDIIEGIGLGPTVRVRLVLDRSGAVNEPVVESDVAILVTDGFVADLPDQSSHVYIIES